MSSAYLLVSHGSRDPRPQIAVSQLAQQLGLLWVDRSHLINTAQLELAATPLHLQIVDFVQSLQDREIEQLVILPLFLIPGVHVMDDIPVEVEVARHLLPELEIIIAPFLGTSPNLTDLFARHRLDLPDQSIILAHGSRRGGGNAIVEEMATKLDLQPAYWSVSPSLGDRVTEFVDTGAKEIGILPYFLFTGGITDAIAVMVAKLREQFPQVQIVLEEPIGNSRGLVTTIDTIVTSITAVDRG